MEAPKGHAAAVPQDMVPSAQILLLLPGRMGSYHWRIRGDRKSLCL
uniref:Uncharacterized protein n=1 Tax=Anguilla anguilla TaxID=7936 RepID=A0A0E9QJI8_ANGAN